MTQLLHNLIFLHYILHRKIEHLLYFAWDYSLPLQGIWKTEMKDTFFLFLPNHHPPFFFKVM